MSEETLLGGDQEKFEFFLKEDKYRELLSSMALEGKTSLTIDFQDLYAYDSELAEKLLEKPEEMLQHFKHAAMAQLFIEDPDYAEKIKEVNIHVRNLYEYTPLREIGAKQIGKLIMIKGIVTKVTVPRPKITRACFECQRCGERQFVIQTSNILRLPVECIHCGKKGPFALVVEESDKINTQEIWLQETPEELPPGQLPTNIRVNVYDDLVNKAMPGDNVALTAIVSANVRKSRGTKLSTCNITLEANHIELLGKEPETIPTLEEISKIRDLAKDPFIHKKVIDSIAPSIQGYEDVKEGIMYLLFGGVEKRHEDIRIRGDINILLVGDPGVAKTQLLKYVASISPRGLYTSGKGATGVGLTAAVTRSKDTGEMTLEAGALVLADKGVACIDEIDKMRDTDRETIHEALEQQTVSIAKGGIVATLNARTAVLAAANPLLGRYDPYKTMAENINLPVTLLSRFDLIFVMRDIPDAEADERLADHLLRLHSGIGRQPPIPPDLLKKYIAYAKTIKPKMTEEATKRLKDFYLSVRKKVYELPNSPISITPRQLESLVRIAEARARVALRKEVTAEDAEAAILIMIKSLRQLGIDLTSESPDIDSLLTGKPKAMRDKMATIIKLIVEGQREMGMVEEKWLLEQLENAYGISKAEAQRLIAQLMREGAIFQPREGFLKKT